MTDQNSEDKDNGEAKISINKHYGYDNWYWLMDQPLEQNLNTATLIQDKS